LLISIILCFNYIDLIYIYIYIYLFIYNKFILNFYLIILYMNENNNYTYQNLEYKNEKSIKNDDIITHSEKQKIHPYRKYQIIILLLLILLFLFIYLIFSLNTE
jgi:hypothetical protein